MNIYALKHIPKSNYAFAYTANSIIVRFRTAKNDIDILNIIYGDKFAWEKRKKYRMNKILSDDLYDYYEIELFLKDKRFAYVFELNKGKDKKVYCETGVKDDYNYDEAYNDFFQFPYINNVDLHIIPEWTEKAVFYQIFVERFNNGDTDNDPVVLNKWGEKPHRDSFYGGDLQGVVDKLDYLTELGITAIYFTPLFESKTNHKYDITDYMSIDKHFGNKHVFKELIEKAHERGIRVVLDAVFNHCGFDFEYFQDVLKNGEKSKYYDWFYIDRYPLEFNPPSYKTFAYEAGMPKLNTGNEEVKNYLINIATYWIKNYDIDGWRLDVSDEIDHQFWRDFRKAVKGAKQDALIIGENWHDSLPWLLGDQFDCVMNYPVTNACSDYFAHERNNAKGFTDELSEIIIRNTKQVNKVQLNLLDSHDAPRFLTVCKGDVKKLKLAALFLMTYIGLPCTYYGTEIGMEGEGDPDCRRTFDWNRDNWNMDLFSFYKTIIRIRKSEKALQKGEIAFKSTEKLFIMERETDNEKIVVAINNTKEKQDMIYNVEGNSVKELLSDDIVTNNNNKIEDSLMPYDGRVYKITKK